MKISRSCRVVFRAIIVENDSTGRSIYETIRDEVQYGGDETFVLVMGTKLWTSGSYPLFFLSMPDHVEKRADNMVLSATMARLLLQQIEHDSDEVILEMLEQAINQEKKEY